MASETPDESLKQDIEDGIPEDCEQPNDGAQDNSVHEERPKPPKADDQREKWHTCPIYYSFTSNGDRK
jgi:hypothetical protein